MMQAWYSEDDSVVVIAVLVPDCGREKSPPLSPTSSSPRIEQDQVHHSPFESSSWAPAVPFHVDVGGRVSTRAGVDHGAVESPVPKHRGRTDEGTYANSASQRRREDRVSTSSRVDRLIHTSATLAGGYRGPRPTILVPPAMLGHGCWRRPSACGGLRRASRATSPRNPPGERVARDGRYWARTSDPQLVEREHVSRSRPPESAKGDG